MRSRQTMRAALASIALFSVLGQPAGAQDAETQSKPSPTGRTHRGGQAAQTMVRPSERMLPGDSDTTHTLELPGRSLKFNATAGTIPFRNAEGRLLGEFAYIAYTMPNTETSKRPVTFAFNGGPGSSSAWLHLGALGPWRLPLDAASPSASASPALIANAETWLDFTDLVFIDPIGTGYSRLAQTSQQQQDAAGQSPTTQSQNRAQSPARDGGTRESGGQRFFWSVNGDVESVAEFIQLWLKKTNRFASPKMIVGESYGGIRAPKVTSALQTRLGVGINAMVLVSPVLDYGDRGSWRGSSPTGLSSVLPSLAASAIEAKDSNVVLQRSVLADAEGYARGDYLADLRRGPDDSAALDRMAKRLASLLNLPEPLVRQYGGRVDSFIYRREANRTTGKVASIYDSSVKAFDPEPTSYFPANNNDPFIAAHAAPMTGAMVDLYATRLKYSVDQPYKMANAAVLGAWVYPNQPYALNSTTELRAALALDPKLKVLVTHGFNDTITPYFASDTVLAQIPAYGGDKSRLGLIVYPGGHMFYSRDASRKAFRDDARKLLE